MKSDSRAVGLGRLAVVLSLAGLVLAGCLAPAQSPRQATTRVETIAQPKVIRLGSIRQPIPGIALFQEGGDTGAQHAPVFHSGLTVYDGQGNLQPRIAQKLPTIDDGDWKLLPDGGMETTWKLRPGVRWHDGTPLSAEDFVFGIRVNQDPEVPAVRAGGIRLVADAVAPDAETLVLRWSSPYVHANRAGVLDFTAVPRHLMADLYERGERQAFVNSAYWSTEFVGLGPYRVGEWVLGSHTVALAFDQYFLGRPRIDRLVIRYFTDANVLVSSVLSGDIDVVTVGSLKLDELLPIMSAWERGGGTTLRMNRDVTIMYLQYRDPNLPWASDVRVRQALVHLLDRQTLADTFLYGLSSVADILADRQDPIYATLEQRNPAKYPYDLPRAERLLADAGWTRGQDGIVRRGGERFSIEVRVQANTQSNVQEGLAAADQWKQGGLDATFLSIAPNAANRNEMKAIHSGVFHTRDTATPATLENFTAAQTPTERNGWRGRNFGDYRSPAYEDLYTRFASEFDASRRQALYADLLKLAADDLPFIPLYYSPGSGTTVFRSGITGPGLVANVDPVTTWNVHAWEAS